MIYYTAYTQKGNNIQYEDRVLINDIILKDGLLYSGMEQTQLISVICDGVSGEENGHIAAQIAVEEFKSCRLANPSPILIMRKIYKIQNEIIKQNQNGRMATTLSGVFIYQNRFIAFYIGDTRIYHISHNHVKQISTDHVTMDNGIKKLSNYLGGAGYSCFPAVRCGNLHSKNDALFICTDGVYTSIPKNEFIRILSSDDSQSSKTKNILQCMKENPVCDDSSFALISME